MAATTDIQFQVSNRIGVVTLNRPQALNALSYEMLVALNQHLDAWANDSAVQCVLVRGAGEKAFCAGGDVRGLYQNYRAGGDLHQRFFAFEYALNHRIWTYPKSYLALLPGIVMGGGMGIAQGARLRIVTDTSRMAMPETAIGLFPDVGASYFLSRLPGELGAFLGLTGYNLRVADIMYAGLADVYLNADALTQLASLLESDTWKSADQLITQIGDLSSTPAAAAPLAAMRSAIDRHFRYRQVGEIVASLRSEADPHAQAWTEGVLSDFAKRSPTLLCVTLEQIRRAKTMTLADCFRMELNLVMRCFEQGDFMEGVRALLMDKDNAPHWNPAQLDQVEKETIESFFTPRWSATQHPLRHLA